MEDARQISIFRSTEFYVVSKDGVFYELTIILTAHEVHILNSRVSVSPCFLVIFQGDLLWHSMHVYFKNAHLHIDCKNDTIKTHHSHL